MKKIIIIMLCMVFLMGTVSALDWDNKLTYSNSDLTVNFSNSFLGITTTGIGSAKLISHNSVNEVRGLSIGSDKIAMVYEFDFKEIYEDGLGEVTITNMKNEEEELKDYYFAEITYEEVDDYTETCEAINGKEVCEKVIIGKKDIEIIGNRININNIPKGKSTIGLIIDVEKEDYYDAVWKIAGKQVDKHALWDADGSYDTSFTTWLFGITNDGTYFYSADYTDQVMYRIWLNGTDSGFTFPIATQAKGIHIQDETIYITITGDNLVHPYFLNGTAKATFATTTIVSPRGGCGDSTGLYWVDDGADKIYKTDYSGNAITNWALSGTNMGGCHSNGTFIWVVDLGNTEIDQHKADGTYLNNDFNWLGDNANGYGITCDNGAHCYTTDSTDDKIYLYEGWGTPVATVTLNSPEDYYNTSSQALTLSGTVSVSIPINVTLFINDVGNETNTTGILGEYNFTKNIAEGTHTWNYQACAVAGCANSSTRTFTIDLTAPNFTVYAPVTDAIAFSFPTNVSLNVSALDETLSTCWYYTSDNATNITYTCNALTNVSFSTGGNKTIYPFANDSVGNENGTSTSFYLNYIVYAPTYDATILEGLNTNYYLNLTATTISNFNGTLYWNSTAYTTTAIDNGTYGTLTTGLTMPAVSSNQNVSFNWVYNFNGVNYNSSNYSQIIYTITQLNFTSASCVDKVLRFDIQEEENLTSLYGDIDYNFKFGTPANPYFKEYYGTLTNVTTAYLCINATVSTNFTLGYGELDYSKSSYVQRKYYLWENQTISNNTLTNHSLRSLLTTAQTSFLLEFEDTSLNVYPKKYMALWRWYPNLNEYQVTDMGKTDENGKSVAHVQAEDVDYRVGLYEKNGTLIKLGDPLRFLCTTTPCTFTLVTDAGETDYTSIFGIEHTLTYNETTNVFTFIFNDPSQKTSTMRLLVTRETGTDTLTLCDTSTTGYTGVISCNTTGYTGIKRAVVYRSASPAVIFAQKVVNTVNSAFNSTFGLFISVFIWIAIVLVGLANSPIWVLILGVIGLIPALVTGAINLAVFTGVAVFAGIVLHFIRRALGK